MLRLTAPLAVVAAIGATLVASPPRHRLHLPIPPLPRSLSVDEQEWSIIPSHTVVAAGTVTFAVYDRGMDAHNLTIKGPGRSLTGPGRLRGSINLQSGASGTLVAHLKPGTYLLYCSLFLGTPDSHYMKGMHTLLTVR